MLFLLLLERIFAGSSGIAFSDFDYPIDRRKCHRIHRNLHRRNRLPRKSALVSNIFQRHFDMRLADSEFLQISKRYAQYENARVYNARSTSFRMPAVIFGY